MDREEFEARVTRCRGQLMRIAGVICRPANVRTRCKAPCF